MQDLPRRPLSTGELIARRRQHPAVDIIAMTREIDQKARFNDLPGVNSTLITLGAVPE